MARNEGWNTYADGYDSAAKDDASEFKRLDAENAALRAEVSKLRAACEASWALGHKVYHQAATPDAPDWVTTRKLLAEALGKLV
jgi:hypothetical protein